MPGRPLCPTRAAPPRTLVASGCAALALAAAACTASPPAGGGPHGGAGRDPDTGVQCSYPDAGDPARPVERPSGLDVPDEGTLPATLRTTAGTIGLTLSRAQAPCTVHSFVSLVDQSYYVDTPCHRLTAPPADVFLLQCGDPTGTGAGGPGYAVPDEPPTGLSPVAGGGGQVIYPRGTVALANHAVPDSGGSQFFLVYRDSPLPPTYTVFGHINADAADALPVLDTVAAAGTDSASAPGDGRPNIPVTIKAVSLPPDH